MSGATGQSRLLRHGGAQAVRRRRRRRRCRAGASACGRGRGCGVSPRCWRDAGSRRLPTAGAWPRRRAGRRSCGGTSAWRSSGRCGIASPGRRKRRRSDRGAGPGAPHPAHRPEDASEKIIIIIIKKNKHQNLSNPARFVLKLQNKEAGGAPSCYPSTSGLGWLPDSRSHRPPGLLEATARSQVAQRSSAATG